MQRPLFILIAAMIAASLLPLAASAQVPISGLPVATQPLAGTETSVIVQGGITKKTAASTLAYNSGPIHVTAGTTASGLSETQTAPATNTSLCNGASLSITQFPCLNYFTTTDAGSTGGTNKAQANWLFQTFAGGSTSLGGREQISTVFDWNAPSNVSNANHFYVGITDNMNVNAGDNGVLGTPQGSFYAGNDQCYVGASAAYVLQCEGREIDLFNLSTTTKARVGQAIISFPQYQGTAYDHALEIGSAGGSGAVAWHNGLFFTSRNGLAPVDTTGALITTDGTAATVAYGINLSGLTFGTAMIAGTFTNGQYVVGTQGQTATSWVNLYPYTIAAGAHQLQACNAGIYGSIQYVSDFNGSPTYRGAIGAGGGSTGTLILCTPAGYVTN